MFVRQFSSSWFKAPRRRRIRHRSIEPRNATTRCADKQAADSELFTSFDEDAARHNIELFRGAARHFDMRLYVMENIYFRQDGFHITVVRVIEKI